MPRGGALRAFLHEVNPHGMVGQVEWADSATLRHRAGARKHRQGHSPGTAGCAAKRLAQRPGLGGWG
eukprot:819436-Lingulodinium_polyedra.AAC.1